MGVTAALALSAPYAAALTFTSGPLLAPDGGRLACWVYNYGDGFENALETVTIEFLTGFGTVVPTGKSCFGNPARSCNSITDDADARVCRVTIKGRTPKSKVRATLMALDSNVTLVDSIELR
jgi:hypothetical protein